MAFAELYRRQVRLLLQALPLVAEEDCFALKGGTAINFFIRNMPRLSVDIDLTYLPLAERDPSLAAIDAALKRIMKRLVGAIPGARVAADRSHGPITKCVLRVYDTQIKVEVTPVLRGCVYPPDLRSVSPMVEQNFGFAEIAVVSFADLYAGKIVAALDRQHPRDIFDARDLLANEGVTDAVRNAFIIYLLSHNRPLTEVLAPNRRDLGQEYARGFDGMTDRPVAREELETTREQLIAIIVGAMPDAHRRFLVGFERGEPDWALLDVVGAAQLPAVRWRQQNLNRMDADKRKSVVQAIEVLLGRQGS